MKHLLPFLLLCLLGIQALAQPSGRLVPIEGDIRKRLSDAESLLSGGRPVEAIDLLENVRRDDRIAVYPALRYKVVFDLARAYALAGQTEKAIATLEEAASMESSRYRDFESEPDFASLRGERRFTELLNDLADHQRPWQQLWQTPQAFESEEADLTDEQKVAGLSLLWSEIRQNFAYFDRAPKLDWDSAYMAALPRVRQARNSVEYYRILQQMTALLQDGHTEVDYPGSVRDSLLFRPAMDTRLVGETVIVNGIHDSEIAALGILPGMELISIDGLSVHEHARRNVLPYQSGSTPHDRATRAYEFRLLSGSCSSPVTVEFRSRDGATFTRTLKRTFAEEDLLWTRTATASDTLAGNIGYLDLTTFYDEYMSNQVAQRLSTLQGTDALIIDLRENGGGYAEAAMQVLSLIMDSSFATHSWETPRYMPYARVENRGLQWHREPADHWSGTGAAAYRKPVVVLTSARTYSAAEHFLVSFRQAGRGVIIGETSGGSTGHTLNVSLPGGGAIFINTTRDYFPDGRKFNGIGVAADMAVKPTLDDIRSGKDPVLWTAIDYLQRRLGRPSTVPIVAALDNRHIAVPTWMPTTRSRGRSAVYTAIDSVRPLR